MGTSKRLVGDLAKLKNAGTMRWQPPSTLTVGELRGLLDELPDEWTVHCIRSAEIRPCVLVRLHPATKRLSFDHVTDVRPPIDLRYETDGEG